MSNKIKLQRTDKLGFTSEREIGFPGSGRKRRDMPAEDHQASHKVPALVWPTPFVICENSESSNLLRVPKSKQTVTQVL